MASVRSAAMCLVDQRASAAIAIPHQQPVHLAIADRQHRGCRSHASSPGQNFRQHLDALQIPRTHRYQAHAFRTFQLGREVIFLLGSYTECWCKAIMSFAVQSETVVYTSSSSCGGECVESRSPFQGLWEGWETDSFIVRLPCFPQPVISTAFGAGGFSMKFDP